MAGGRADHPLCSFAACIPPKEYTVEQARCVERVNARIRTRSRVPAQPDMMHLVPRVLGAGRRWSEEELAEMTDVDV